jgi:hypothetical protein
MAHHPFFFVRAPLRPLAIDAVQARGPEDAAWRYRSARAAKTASTRSRPSACESRPARTARATLREATPCQPGRSPAVFPAMALSSLHALGFRTAREKMEEILREDGTNPDYSVASLEGLERTLARFRGPADEPPAPSPDELHQLQVRAGAYAAEVLLRAVPGADVSLKDGEMVLNLPSGVIPGLRFEAYPRLRVVKVLRGEEALLDWAVFFLALTVEASAGPES